jgi:ZIP family zinc transporter
VLDAFSLGVLAQSSLLVAGLLVCWLKVPTRLVGILAGFGAGAMISAIAFDLVPEAQAHIEEWETVLWMLIGVGVFLAGDWFVDKKFGTAGAGGAMGIVVGSVVDGVPESAILGIQVGIGITISLGFVAAVFISNIPQAVAPSADLAASGWGPRKLGQLWLLVVLACGVAAALGFLGTDLTGAVVGDRAAALAAGGLLAMLTNSLIPFSFERGGSLAGAATALGFCLSVINS